MANSKNTIQRIPLNGTLNMNTLKTDVRQFEGFNEKNSTVFGGTLSPFFDKTTTLGNKDDSYTIFNSKGEPYTLTTRNGQVELLKYGSRVFSGINICSSKTETMDVPQDTISAAIDTEGNLIYVTKSGTIKYLNGLIQGTSTFLGARIFVEPSTTYIVAVTSTTARVIIKRAGVIQAHDETISLKYEISPTHIPLITGGATDDGLFNISILTNSGRLYIKPGNATNFGTNLYTVDSGNNIKRSTRRGYWKESLGSKKPELVVLGGYLGKTITYECHQFAFRELVRDKDTYFLPGDKACGAVDGYLPCPVGQNYSFNGSAYYLDSSLISIGHMNQPIAPCLSFEDNTVNKRHDANGNLHIFYHGTNDKWYHYQSASVVASDDKVELFKGMVFDGRYIFLRDKRFARTVVYDIETDNRIRDVKLDWILDSTPWVEKSDLTLVERPSYYTFENTFTLKATRPNDGSNKVHIEISQREAEPEVEHVYRIIGTMQDSSFDATLPFGPYDNLPYGIDWDYGSGTGDATITVTEVSNTDYLAPASVTVSLGGTAETTSLWRMERDGLELVYDTTGCVFGGGYNAGYAISNSPFVGYLPNPYVVSNFPKSSIVNYPEVPQGAQFYCTIGDQAMSAEYAGRDAKYLGTTLAIDSSGNVILPVSSSGKIVSGYSNNDLVRENGASYPLMYWNNSQKMYAYFLLSGIENMTGVFSLQGQQYTVDDNNIYAVSFANGIVQNVQAVCYKKNLQFLGTLPSQAIFWSDFNKTLYSFTGDRLVSKMFEASDIGEVRYVGQNPSSLSLWICTDKGIYILSNTDQYRLDFVCEEVVFIEDSALVIVPEDDGKRRVHQISLWDIGNKSVMFPVKLKTAYFGLGAEQKSVMDCWYIRLFDENRMEGEVKARVNTITDVTRHSEEKTFKINPSDYDENNIVYLRYQPKYQECTAMQLELESNIGIYELAIGVNATDSTAQVGKLNF